MGNCSRFAAAKLYLFPGSGCTTVRPAMTDTVVLHTRVRADLKEGAQAVFRELGLTMTDAISMFLAAVNRTRSLPLDTKIPNAATRRALRKSARGKDLHGPFSSAAELIADALK